MDLYQSLLRPILFSGVKADPEWLHQQSLSILAWIDRPKADPLTQRVRTRLQKACSVSSDRLQQNVWDLSFANPIGLAAGFDKNGVASGVWSYFGFGFAELGTVTYHAQPGNAKPRLFRLPLDQAALNRMGFNNEGATVLAETLTRRWPGSVTKVINNENHPTSSVSVAPGFPLGINLGKSKITPLEAAAEDYLNSFRLLKTWGDYFVVNVSSPNTPGLRSLQDKEQLEPILQALQQENTERKPILVKIAPDLEWDAIADVIALVEQHHLAGIIATNTTIRRDGLKTQMIEKTGKAVSEEAGGISGAPVRQRSTEVIRFIYKETNGRLPIIGVGGIFNADDAWEKITAGASLAQIYTGWIYQGPLMVRQILEGLLQKLDEHGLNTISEAVGLSHR